RLAFESISISYFRLRWRHGERGAHEPERIDGRDAHSVLATNRPVRVLDPELCRGLVSRLHLMTHRVAGTGSGTQAEERVFLSACSIETDKRVRRLAHHIRTTAHFISSSHDRTPSFIGYVSTKKGS